MRADDVRNDEDRWVVDAPVHERLGRGVDHGIGFLHEGPDDLGVADVAEDETESRIPLVIGEVLPIARVRELVQHRHGGAWPSHREIDEVRSDEPRAAGDQEVTRSAHPETAFGASIERRSRKVLRSIRSETTARCTRPSVSTITSSERSREYIDRKSASSPG